MSQLRTWTWDEICDLQEELEDQVLDQYRPRAQPHAVYWIYGPHDLILYIGCTRNPRKRLATHKCLHKETWWPYVHRTEIVWYPDFSTALGVETAELRSHRPLCNPVIPEADGKHRTTTSGRKPVRSLWAQVDEVARQRDETVYAVIGRALARYVRQHQKPKEDQS